MMALFLRHKLGLQTSGLPQWLKHHRPVSRLVGIAVKSTVCLTSSAPTLMCLFADGPSGLHRYKLRLLFDAVEMRWDWPVDVNVHEAAAYCAWKTAQDGQLVKYRLITEAEHNCIRNKRDRVDAVVRPPTSAAAAAVAAAEKGVKTVISIGVVAAGAAVGAGGSPAADPAVNVDMAMVVSGSDAVKVRQCGVLKCVGGLSCIGAACLSRSFVLMAAAYCCLLQVDCNSSWCRT